MLIKQALSEVLQLVASQLLPSQFVFSECLRLFRKTESWHWLAWRRAREVNGLRAIGGRLEPKSPPAFVAKEKNANPACMCDGRAFEARHPPQRMLSPQRTSL
jgi:hypothetical protein